MRGIQKQSNMTKGPRGWLCDLWVQRTLGYGGSLGPGNRVGVVCRVCPNISMNIFFFFFSPGFIILVLSHKACHGSGRYQDSTKPDRNRGLQP